MKAVFKRSFTRSILCVLMMVVLAAGAVCYATDAEYDGKSIWVYGTDFMDATAQIEGDHMAYTCADTYAIYDGLDFGEGNDYYAFRIMAGSPKSGDCQGGSVEIRIGDTEGELIGTLNFTPKIDGSWSYYEEHAVVIEKPELLKGVVDICLVFKPVSTYLFNYNEFTFDTNEVVEVVEEEAADEAPNVEDLTYDGVVWKEGIDVADLTTQIEGDHIGYTTNGSYTLYKYLYFAEGCDHYDFTICMGAPDGQGGFVEAHLGAPDGELIASVEITPTGDWAAYQEFTVEAEKPELLKDLVDICLVFYPYDGSTYVGNYTEFWFEGDSVNIPEAEPAEAEPAVEETEAKAEETEPAETDAPAAEETDAPAAKENAPAEAPAAEQSAAEQPAEESSAAPVIIVIAAVVVILAVVIVIVVKKKK